MKKKITITVDIEVLQEFQKRFPFISLSSFLNECLKAYIQTPDAQFQVKASKFARLKASGAL